MAHEVKELGRVLLKVLGVGDKLWEDLNEFGDYTVYDNQVEEIIAAVRAKGFKLPLQNLLRGMMHKNIEKRSSFDEILRETAEIFESGNGKQKETVHLSRKTLKLEPGNEYNLSFKPLNFALRLSVRAFMQDSLVLI